LGQLPAQQRVPAISVLPAFETQSEKNSSTMLTQNMSGVSYVSSYVGDHSVRHLQLQAVMFHFFRKTAGLVPAATEAPWKKNWHR